MALSKEKNCSRFMALAFILGLFIPKGAQAAIINVDTIAAEGVLFNGNCTLREATVAAETDADVDGCTLEPSTEPDDIIMLPAGIYKLSGAAGEDLNGSGDLDIMESVTIIGAQDGSTIIDGVGLDAMDRIFHVQSGTLTLQYLTLQNGSALDGGAIYVEDGESVIIRQSTLANNDAIRGGAIFAIANFGIDSVIIENSTFNNNAASGDAIYLDNLAGANISHTTFGFEDRLQQTVHIDSGSITFNYSIVDTCSVGIGAILDDAGHNLGPDESCGLVDDDNGDIVDTTIGLEIFGDNGGPTSTFDLSATSPAIGGATGSAATVDQRGFTRIEPIDIGAIDLGCGNGQEEAANNETCDDGNADDTDACPTTCQDAVCGDGFVQTDVEACDDGNITDGDGCSSTCTLESDAICGNGVEETDETCDDSNTDNGDGCSSTCQEESSGGGGGCSLGTGGYPALWLGFLSLLSLSVYRRTKA